MGSISGARLTNGAPPYLEARGYRVLRFWNHEVLTGLESVLDTIHAALNDTSG